MKILHLSTFDVLGGAARAAHRLHRGLRDNGHNSQMMVQLKISDDDSVVGSESYWGKAMGIIRQELDQMLLKFYSRKENTLFDIQMIPRFLKSDIEELDPDIIHLHWICGGYLSVESLAKIEKPIVWTLHDMWPFTGGCHYSGECRQYEESCGRCPQLGSRRENDLSRRVWKRKQQAWKNISPIIISPSHWLASCARSSSLFGDYRVEVIANGLNMGQFKPLDKMVAREALGLKPDKKYILFSAMGNVTNKRKGLHLLLEALSRLTKKFGRNDLTLLVLGASSIADFQQTGIDCHCFGRLYDEVSVSLVYNAADIFTAPSIQDNLPNTVMEAMACGVPCATFNVGGMADMIDHEANGYLARPFEVEDYVRGMCYLLDGEHSRSLSRQAREQAVKRFDLNVQADKYHRMYLEALADYHPPVAAKPLVALKAFQ